MPLIKRPVRFRRIFRPGPKGSTPVFLKVLIAALIILGLCLLIAIPTNRYLDDVASQTALNHAAVLLRSTVNNTVNEMLDDSTYSYGYFVDLQRDTSGNVIAVAANMARINRFSTEVLGSVISATESGEIELSVPLGTLLRSSVFLGRGPDIPVRITVLTTSSASFSNQFEAVGINQSRHQIMLDIVMELDVVLPWEIESSIVDCQVLVAETIIVGGVPDTYLNLTP
jgi:sporulation protein YunB